MAGDPSWASVGLLLHAEGVQGSTSLTDSSASAKAMTAAGGAIVSTAQAKFGNSSMKFSAAGDRFTTPAVADFFFGTGDFTIEAFVNPTALPAGSGQIMGFQNYGTGSLWIFVLSSSGNLQLYTGTGGVTNSSAGTVPTNAWTHVAAARQGSTLRLFIGGVLSGTFTNAANYSTYANPFAIGGDNSGNTNAQFSGYIDEVRVTKGLARYTASFTPPAAAFADGMGQVSGAVTDSSAAAAVRKVRAFRRYDGVLVAERYTCAADANINKVAALFHGDSLTGADLAARTIALSGNAKIDVKTLIADSPKAFSFDGTNSYARVAQSADFNPGNTDWTLEFDIIVSNLSTSPYLAQLYNAAGERFALQPLANGTLTAFCAKSGAGTATNVSSAGAIVNGQKHNIMVCALAGTTYVFIDGVLTYSGVLANSYTNTSCFLEFGAAVASAAAWLSGWIGNIRFTRGLARYTAGFTAVAARLPDATAVALGSYSFYTPTLDELTVIAYDAAANAPLYDDVCARVIPA